MSRRKSPTKPETSATVALPGDTAINVTGEVVLNPVTRAPVTGPHGSKYKSEYCVAILDFFRMMLAKSGEKILEKMTEETRTLSEKPRRGKNSGEEEEEGKPKRRRAGHVVITEKRTVKGQEWRMVMAELPSMQKFAGSIGISTGTMKNWRDLYPSFEEACAMATDLLEDALVQRGLWGVYDTEMVKFIGKNWGTMRDRHEVTGADGAPLNPPAELRSVSTEELSAVKELLMAAKQRLIDAANKGDG